MVSRCMYATKKRRDVVWVVRRRAFFKSKHSVEDATYENGSVFLLGFEAWVLWSAKPSFEKEGRRCGCIIGLHR